MDPIAPLANSLLTVDQEEFDILTLTAFRDDELKSKFCLRWLPRVVITEDDDGWVDFTTPPSIRPKRIIFKNTPNNLTEEEYNIGLAVIDYIIGHNHGTLMHRQKFTKAEVFAFQIRALTNKKFDKIIRDIDINVSWAEVVVAEVGFTYHSIKFPSTEDKIDFVTKFVSGTIDNELVERVSTGAPSPSVDYLELGYVHISAEEPEDCLLEEPFRKFNALVELVTPSEAHIDRNFSDFRLWMPATRVIDCMRIKMESEAEKIKMLKEMAEKENDDTRQKAIRSYMEASFDQILSFLGSAHTSLGDLTRDDFDDSVPIIQEEERMNASAILDAGLLFVNMTDIMHYARSIVYPE